MIENVKGAQPWVGKAQANFGSYYLWADVAQVGKRIVRRDAGFGEEALVTAGRGVAKVPGFNFHQHEKTGGGPEGSFQTAAVKNTGGLGQNPVNGVKQCGLSGPLWFDQGAAAHSSESDSRKAASAMIARIPLPLARHVARMFTVAQTREL